MTSKTEDLYTAVTATIIDLLTATEISGADWSTPWRALGLGHRSALGRSYRGINTLLLACAQERGRYEFPVWATYRQWAGLDAQVNRGEKATTVVLWKSYTRKDKADPDAPARGGMFATSFNVFNVAQVTGADDIPAMRDYVAPRVIGARDDAAEQWIASTGADIAHGGDRAYYTPAADRIQLPRFEDFNTATDYYSVAAHELTHWSGHASRLDRDLSGRFGNASYAAEELIAELGAAFSMARLGLEATPRSDHAAYIASWLEILRADNRAVFTAASKAQAACDYLHGTETAAASTETETQLVAVAS